MDGERCRSQPRKTSESPSRNVKRVTRLHLHLRKKKPKRYAGMTDGKEAGNITSGDNTKTKARNSLQWENLWRGGSRLQRLHQKVRQNES